MNELLLFAPLLGFSLIGTILNIMNKLKFKPMLILGAITLISYIFISIYLKIFLLVPIIQIIVAVIVMLTLIMLLGKKASGNTLMLFSVLIGVTPVTLWGGLNFVLFMSILIGIYIKEILSSQNKFKEVQADITTAVYGTGMGVSLPNFDHLEDKSITDKKRFTVFPILFISTSTVLLIQLIILILA